jgi:hypothetical protein
MSVSKIIAGVVALALSAAVVTALAGATPEEKADRPAAAAKADQPETKASRLETKAERPETGSNAARSSHSFACPKEPWPYGCKWREPPTRRVTRGSRQTG